MQERLFDLAVAAALPLIAATALSERQRRAIRERDQFSCQFPVEHECSGECEAHHVRPQKWLKDQRVSRKERDRPNNLLLVCEAAHKIIHPMVLFDSHRNQLLRTNQIYWDNSYDEDMARVAERRTKEARKSGWMYPARVIRKRK